MYKKIILFYVIVLIGILQAAAQTVVVTPPKTVKKSDDLLGITFPPGNYQNKKYYLEMAIYSASKVIITGTTNIFSIVDNAPDDIFFTQFTVKDNAFAAVSSSSSDLPAGDYQVQYRVSSLTPKAIIVSQMENITVGKKGAGKKEVVKEEPKKEEPKKEEPKKAEPKKEVTKKEPAKENPPAKNTPPTPPTPAKPAEPAPGGLKFSGYADAYYGYYTDSIGINEYQKFPSVSPRSKHIGLNTAMITAQYDGDKYRGIVSLHFGDIARSTWSSTFNPIMEAHVGILLHKNLWLDGGFFRTHFGTEGLLPKENLTSSVAVATFYEPYYEAGFRLNYQYNDKLALNLYVLNGYNLFEDNNRKKSLGMLITYALSDKGNIGYSNYIGDDTPDSLASTVSHVRFHNNLFWNYTVKKLKIQAGTDFCFQQNSSITGTGMGKMVSGLLTLKYSLNKKVAAWERSEFFRDKDGCMSGVIKDRLGNMTGYKMFGQTIGLEFKPEDNYYLRLEGRMIFMDKDQEIFIWDGTIRNYRSELTMSMGVSF